MSKIVLPFANAFYESDSLKISAQECVNFYPVTEDSPSLQQETLRTTPGMTLADDVGDVTKTNRGGHALNGTPYFVQGDTLYRLESDETLTAITGTIAGTDRCVMDDNGTQLMIQVPGGDGYIFTESPDTLTQITDTDYTTTNGAPYGLEFIDGYFVVTTDDKKFKISSLNDGLTWSALDFGTAESSPDGVVAPVVFRNQLFIGGERTIEGFSNVGGTDFPFTRTGLFFDEGFSSVYSVVNAQGTFCFMGAGEDEAPAVWMLVGNETQKISTRAIDKVLKTLTVAELAAVFTWSYAQMGNYFVGFQLPDTTFVYDMTTGKWHERRSFYDGSPATGDAYRLSSVVEAYGKLYVGDVYSDRILILDTVAASENGNNIERWFATMPFQNNMDALFVPYLELTVDPDLEIGSIGGGDRTAAGPPGGDYGSGSSCIPAYITTQPTDYDYWDTGDPVVFTVTASGSTPLTYQWYENGVAMSGETSATLSTTNAVANGNTYYVEVSNACGTARSDSVISVQTNPDYDADNLYNFMVNTLQPDGMWVMDDTSGTTATDYSGNGNHLSAIASYGWGQASFLDDGRTTARSTTGQFRDTSPSFISGGSSVEFSGGGIVGTGSGSFDGTLLRCEWGGDNFSFTENANKWEVQCRVNSLDTVTSTVDIVSGSMVSFNASINFLTGAWSCDIYINGSFQETISGNAGAGTSAGAGSWFYIHSAGDGGDGQYFWYKDEHISAATHAALGLARANTIQ